MKNVRQIKKFVEYKLFVGFRETEKGDESKKIEKGR